MQQMYSVQYASNIAKLLGALLTLFGIEVAQEDLISFIGVSLIFVSVAISIIDRFKKGDVKWYGKRKK